MNSLPIEIITNIVAYCPINHNSRRRPCLAPYALISKQWQRVVEQRLFSSLKLKSSELEFFASLYGAEPEREHRRSALQRLEYSIEAIPDIYETLKGKSPSERAALRQSNTCSVLESLNALYSVLRSWPTSRCIILNLRLPGHISSPPDVIPMTELVKGFIVDSISPLTTAMLEPIDSRMDGLQEIGCKLPDRDDTSNSVTRRKQRYHPSTATPFDEGVHNVLTIINEQDHARYRKVLNPAFSDKALKEQETYIMSHVHLLMAKLHHRRDEGPQIIVKWSNLIYFDIIADLTFGQSLHGLENEDYHPWLKGLLEVQ